MPISLQLKAPQGKTTPSLWGLVFHAGLANTNIQYVVRKSLEGKTQEWPMLERDTSFVKTLEFTKILAERI